MVIDIPKCRETINPSNYHIDATPDGEYAIRILRFYRELTNTKFIIEGPDTDSLNALYQAMNQHQDQRAKELDIAIKLLQSERKE